MKAKLERYGIILVNNLRVFFLTVLTVSTLFWGLGFISYSHQEDECPDSSNVSLQIYEAITSRSGLLEEKLRRAISKVAKDPDSLTIDVDYSNNVQLMGGKFSKIIIKMKRPTINDLKIEKATFVFQDITLDMGALWNNYQLLPKSGGSAALAGLIKEEDINEFLVEKTDKTGVSNPNIKFEKGKLNLSGKIKTGFFGMPVTINVNSAGKFILRDNGQRIDYVTNSVKVNRAPLPAFIRNKVIQTINPVLDLSILPFEAYLDKIEIVDGCLILVSSSAEKEN